MRFRIDAGPPRLDARRPVKLRAFFSLLGLAASFALVHCRQGEQVGSETHFLRLCPDGECSLGDQCVCGVCTVACDTIDACGARLAKDSVDGAALDLVCRAPACSSETDQASAPGAVCDVVCSQDRDCKPLGDSFTCE